MTQSMTGYSRVVHHVGPATVTVELRSTNHRYLEISQRLPDGLAGLEGHLTQLLRSHMQRGRVDVNVTAQVPSLSSRRVAVDVALAEAYHTTLLELTGRFGLKGGVTLDHLLALPRLVEVKDETDQRLPAWGPGVKLAVEQAVRELVAARKREGSRLVRDVGAQALRIRRQLQAIRRRLPHSAAQQKRRLQERVSLLLGTKTSATASQIHEALAIVKDVDIHEELVRLDSHLVHLRQVLASRKPVGKTVDFIAQEMTRETNTIGAKVNDADIARFVIEIKEAIEKIREQTRNLE